MKLHQLIRLTHRSRRVGRGIAAGQGKTAGRGTKGQKARTGHGAPVGFEGGQTRLYRRLPKVGGFRSHIDHPVTITLASLNGAFRDGDRIDTTSLIRAGLIRAGQRACLVATGQLTRRGLRLAGDVACTPAARSRLTAANEA